MVAYFADYIADLVMDQFPLYAVDYTYSWGWFCFEVLEIEDDTAPGATGFNWIK